MDRDIALVVNPTSGGGRGRRYGEAAAVRLRAAGHTVTVRTGRDVRESLDMAHEAVADGVDTLAVVGGDGMVHLGLQAVADTDTAFGIVPAGTGNDIARAIGVPLKDPAVAAGIISERRERKIDLGRCGEQWFGGVVAAGFDARVNERANRMRRPRGRMRYNIAMLAELGVFRPVPYELELDGERWDTSAMLVVVGNGRSYGGGMLVIPEAQLDDGMLDVLVVKPVSKATFLRVFPKVYSGTHLSLPFVETRRARSVRISAPDIVAYVDGERLGPLPQTFDAVPGAARVLVPPG